MTTTSFPHPAGRVVSRFIAFGIVLALSASLSGCAPATAPVNSEGTVQACPAGFVDYIRKTVTTQHRPGQVTEVGANSFPNLPELTPVCVVAFSGTRKLPSGQPEPTEYTALLTGTTLNDAATLAESKGFTTPQPTHDTTHIAYRKNDTFLTITAHTGNEIGIPNDPTTYLILTTFTSEEISKLRPTG